MMTNNMTMNDFDCTSILAFNLNATNCNKNDDNTATLSSQIKIDIEQQNAIKLQQYEAIRLIQISLDKLASTSTVQLNIPQQHQNNNNNNTTNNNKNQSNTPTQSVLVYKETNLHKNLLQMNLAHQQQQQQQQQRKEQNADDSDNKKNNNLDENSANLSYDETSIIEEMKSLMQQIWQINLNNPTSSAYQFDTTNATNNYSINNNGNNQLGQLVNSTVTYQESNNTNDNINKINNNKSEIANTNESEQMKRIKKLNDVKQSLYSLLFAPNSKQSTTIANTSDLSASGDQSNNLPKAKKENLKNSIANLNSNNNSRKKKRSINYNLICKDTTDNNDSDDMVAKRSKSDDSIAANGNKRLKKTKLDYSNSNEILNDDTNKQKVKQKAFNNKKIATTSCINLNNPLSHKYPSNNALHEKISAKSNESTSTLVDSASKLKINTSLNPSYKISNRKMSTPASSSSLKANLLSTTSTPTMPLSNTNSTSTTASTTSNFFNFQVLV